MLKAIKTLVAALFVICLFLPLSSCQYQVPDPQTNTMHDRLEMYYVMPDEKTGLDAWRYVPVVVFLLPLLFSLPALVDRQSHVLLEVGGFLAAVLILFYIAVHAYFTRLEPGGYLTLFTALVYIVLTMTTLVLRIIEGRRQHVNHPG